MAIIAPVSDLRNYNTVLEKVTEDTPVFLTVNGRGRYMVSDISLDEKVRRLEAAVELLVDLHEGRASAAKSDYISLEEVKKKLGL